MIKGDTIHMSRKKRDRVPTFTLYTKGAGLSVGRARLMTERQEVDITHCHVTLYVNSLPAAILCQLDG